MGAAREDAYLGCVRGALFRLRDSCRDSGDPSRCIQCSTRSGRCEPTPPNLRVVARHLFAALAAVKQSATKTNKSVRITILPWLPYYRGITNGSIGARGVAHDGQAPPPSRRTL